MKVYRVCIASDTEGTILGWAASQKTARARAKKLLEEACDGRRFDKSIDSIDPMEIRTTKAGLISWLNAFFTTNNG